MTRAIDTLMMDYNFKNILDSQKGMYEYVYEAIVKKVDIVNITATLAKITYDVKFLMSKKEWEKFDKVRFEISIRAKHYAQANYIGITPVEGGLVLVGYEIRITDKV